ncbi:hypothetical protein ACWDLG_33150 [Nonomuraea sp. NPDC003727]
MPPSWPDVPASRPDARDERGPGAWSDTSRHEPVPTAWPEASRIEPASGSWPEAPRANGSAPAWPEQAPPAREPLPAWSNLSTPAPWPPRDSAAAPPAPDPLGGIDPADPLGAGTSPSHPRLNPPAGNPAPGGHPGGPVQSGPVYGDPRQGAPAQGGPLHGDPLHGGPHQGAPLGADPRTMGAPAGHPQPGGHQQAGGPLMNAADAAGPAAPGPMTGVPGEQRPGAQLSRDPSDPDNRFVTAGQISGSRTPPPERQQELWNTVFGDGDEEAIGAEDSDDDGPGKPVWIYALAGSIGIALVAALLWAFLAGPLAKETSASPAAEPSPTASTAKPPTKKPSVGRLPRFQGTPSPVMGVTADSTAGISVPRLGGPWKADVRTTMKSTYGYSTRQFSPAGTDASGKPVVAQVMTGPLPARLAGTYSSPDDLEPVIKAVVVSARKLYFATPNIARKTATQTLKVGDLPAQLNAYEVTVDGAKTTVVAAAINTGADVPAIVYMSVPSEHKELLPDINSVFKQIKPTAAS